MAAKENREIPLGSLNQDSGLPQPVFDQDEDILSLISGRNAERQPIEAGPRAGLVAKYSLFKEKVHPKTDVVYHPSSANDISPSVAFPDSRVVYVDIDDESMEAARKKGLEAHTASALEFNPGAVDVLIMLNPAISPDIPSSHVVQGGYILCNDYHGTASDLRKNDEYALVAMIRPGPSKLLFDTENLDDYWKEIDTEEEFKQAPPGFGAENYKNAASAVEAITGKKDNVLAEYKNIIAKAKEEGRRQNEELGIEDVPDDDIIMLTNGEQQLILQTTLPKKKGTVDDMFVFRKVGKSTRNPQAAK
jgi:hypothetical protein